MTDLETLPADKWGTGRLQGFRKWEGFDPFEEHTGPYYFRELEDGSYLCAFEVADHNLNGGGAVHGGAFMTFADFALFVFARPALEGISAVTVSFNCELVGAGLKGDLILSTGEIVQETGSMVFVRGTMVAERDAAAQPVPVLNYSGILRKMRK